MKSEIEAGSYSYTNAELGHHHAWLLPAVHRVIEAVPDRRIFDLGCGNGAVAAELSQLGFDVRGVDTSQEGIKWGKLAYPQVKLDQGSAYDELARQYGTFPIVISLEVVEHLYNPKSFATTLYNLVEPGGLAVVSTPYHGYWKNLALAVSGRFDHHFSPLWDHGHIKFWSTATLTKLLRDAGFEDVAIRRLGRIPVLAKSMLAIAQKGR